MTKQRAPLTFGDATMRIAGRLGIEAAAAAVGRSATLVRAWSDDDDPRLPNIAQARALDAAYLAAGGESAPLLETYAHQLNAEMASSIASHLALAADLAAAAKESGEATACVLAVQPGAGLSEIFRAIAECAEAKRAWEALVLRLTAIRNARGSHGHNYGGMT